jgi:hypothetical protein
MGALHFLCNFKELFSIQVELQSWDNWGQGDGPVDINVVDNGMANNVNNYQSGTPGYHSNQTKNPESQEELDVDYFQDMMPRFKRPKMVGDCNQGD